MYRSFERSMVSFKPQHTLCHRSAQPKGTAVLLCDENLLVVSGTPSNSPTNPITNNIHPVGMSRILPREQLSVVWRSFAVLQETAQFSLPHSPHASPQYSLHPVYLFRNFPKGIKRPRSILFFYPKKSFGYHPPCAT